MLRVLFILVAILLLAGAGGYAYMGGFNKVEVTRGSFGPTEIAYTTYRGSYTQIGASWLAFAEELELTAGLTRCDALAVYLDEPDTAPEDQRAIMGCRTDGLNWAEKKSLYENFPLTVLPQSETLSASFPLKNFFSYILGPLKVYPAFAEYAEGHDLETVLAIELYGVDGEEEEIRYLMPVGIDESAYQDLYDAF